MTSNNDAERTEGRYEVAEVYLHVDGPEKLQGVMETATGRTLMPPEIVDLLNAAQPSAGGSCCRDCVCGHGLSIHNDGPEMPCAGITDGRYCETCTGFSPKHEAEPAAWAVSFEDRRVLGLGLTLWHHERGHGGPTHECVERCKGIWDALFAAPTVAGEGGGVMAVLNSINWEDAVCAGDEMHLDGFYLTIEQGDRLGRAIDAANATPVAGASEKGSAMIDYTMQGQTERVRHWRVAVYRKMPKVRWPYITGKKPTGGREQ